MTWRADLDALRERQEALVAFTVGADQTLALVRKTAGSGREAVWQSTWDGSRLPQSWVPFAWFAATPPDPALLDNGYE